MGTFANKAMQPMSGFGIQFNKNSFGLTPAQPLNVPAVPPNQSVDVSLPLNTSGAIQKMEPLTNLQVAIKNSIDVFYFATIVPTHVYFGEDGNMEKKVFLATWKDIPAQMKFNFLLRELIVMQMECLQKYTKTTSLLWLRELWRVKIWFINLSNSRIMFGLFVN